MATTETDVSVINKSLAKFGGGAIQSLDDGSDLASIVSQLYPVVRDNLLSIHPWRFAMKKRQLARSASEKPINEWDHAYMLPADMLSAPRAVFGDGAELPTGAFEVYGDFIYCNYNTVIIDYIYRPDESLWPSWFVALAVTAGAGEFSIPVADQVSKSEMFERKAFGSPQMMGRGGMFAQCRRMDAQAQATKSIFQNGDPLTRARLNGVVARVEGEAP